MSAYLPCRAPARLPLLLRWVVAFFASAILAGPGAHARENAPGGAAVETIIMLRHGEKPPGGLGQLNCQGLNRALALPAVIGARFGTPDYVFAPNPAALKVDGRNSFHYIRPLMTVEPTAIHFGRPVDTTFGYKQYQRLGTALGQRRYHDATILIGWEHRMLPPLARQLLAAHGGDASQVPDWPWDSFDRMYIIKITRPPHGPATSTFAVDYEHLDNLPDKCPGVGAPAQPAAASEAHPR